MKDEWKDLQERVLACQGCPLCDSRNRVVFGDGNPASPIWIIGEAPGREEDEQGKPFVGRSGKLLDKLLGKVGLDRTKVFITNTIKCRPPQNRNPHASEMRACSEHLDTQMALYPPKVVVVLGNVSLKRVFGKEACKISQMRGSFWPSDRGYEIFPMFHPSYLLRNLSDKEGGPLWLTVEDCKKLKDKYDEILRSAS